MQINGDQMSLGQEYSTMHHDTSKLHRQVLLGKNMDFNSYAHKPNGPTMMSK